MVHNLIIIGSGPAGYTAAIYAGRSALQPVIFAGAASGGQLMMTTEIENFPGFEKGVMGPQLMQMMRNQAARFESTIIDENVTKVDFSKRPFRVWQEETEYQAQAIIIATGAQALTLGLPNEKFYYGRGLSSCAVCDAAFFRGKQVYVVGGGDSACEDALALTKFTPNVHLIVRRDSLRASKIMQTKVLEHPHVEVHWNTQVIGINGEVKITALRLLDMISKKEREVPADGLFYAIGHKPKTELFVNQVEMDNKGYILTTMTGLKGRQGMYETWGKEYPTMTSVLGVFGAGDVVDFRYRQAIVAAGLGAMAALDVEKWLNTQKE